MQMPHVHKGKKSVWFVSIQKHVLQIAVSQLRLFSLSSTLNANNRNMFVLAWLKCCKIFQLFQFVFLLLERLLDIIFFLNKLDKLLLLLLL